MPHKDPEARRAYARAYYAEYNKRPEQRAKLAKWKREHRAKEPEKFRGYAERYRRAHPERIKQYQQRAEVRRLHGALEARLKRQASRAARKARQLGAAGNCSADQWMARIEYYGWACAYCGKKLELSNMHREHVKPLVLGGSEWPANLVPACQRCNCQKGPRRWIPRPVWAKETLNG